MRMKYTLCALVFASLTFSVPAFAETPKRIVSLAPNITEILFALGLEDRIVAVTSFCDYPEGTEGKQKVGGMSNPSLERVVSLQPDMVIMTTDGNPKAFAERLASFRVKTYIFRTRTLSELPRGIRLMGSVLDVRGKADKLAADIETALKNLSHRITSVSQRKKVLFVVWPEPLIVAGPGTAIDDAITLLGHSNIARGAQSSYPKYSLEEIMLQAPDVIFIGKGHADMRKMSQGFLDKISGTPAVRHHHVFFIGDNLYRLGPRIISGIEEIAACLR